MKHVNKKHIEYFQYIVLLAVFFFASHLFLALDESLLKFYVVLITALFYVLWGIWHHNHVNRLDRVIVLEYILVSIVAVALAAMGLGVIRFI